MMSVFIFIVVTASYVALGLLAYLAAVSARRAGARCNLAVAECSKLRADARQTRAALLKMLDTLERRDAKRAAMIREQLDGVQFRDRPTPPARVSPAGAPVTPLMIQRAMGKLYDERAAA